MEILGKRAHGSNEIPGRPPSTRRLPFNFIPDREVLANVGGDPSLDRPYPGVGEQAAPSRQLVRRMTESGYIKFGRLNVEPQKAPVYLDSIGEDAGQAMLEIADATAQATSLLLWVDARKSLLSEHLSMNR